MKKEANATHVVSQSILVKEKTYCCVCEKCLKSTHLRKRFCCWVLLLAFATLFVISAEVQLRGSKCLNTQLMDIKGDRWKNYR